MTLGDELGRLVQALDASPGDFGTVSSGGRRLRRTRRTVATVAAAAVIVAGTAAAVGIDRGSSSAELGPGDGSAVSSEPTEVLRFCDTPEADRARVVAQDPLEVAEAASPDSTFDDAESPFPNQAVYFVNDADGNTQGVLTVSRQSDGTWRFSSFESC